MNAYNIVKECRQAGIQLSVENDNIKVVGLDTTKHADLLAQIKQHKPEIIEFLNKEQVVLGAQPTGLNVLTRSDFPWAVLSDEILASPALQTAQTENIYIATPMQSGLIFHGLMEGSASYTSIAYCDLEGDLDIEAFTGAWQYIIQRHAIFRTSFIGMAEKQIHQLVHNSVDTPLKVLDWRERLQGGMEEALQAFRTQDKETGFDFDNAPLMRLTLIRISDSTYHFVWSHHHTLLDGWCLPIVFQEVMDCYRALLEQKSPDLPVTPEYEKYIGWLYQQDKEQAKTFWQQKLQGITAPTPLRVDQLKDICEVSEETERKHCTHKLTLTASLTKDLESLVKTSRCTMNTLLQAAWGLLLSRYSGEQDVVFGSTVSGRPAELDGIESMIGLFINTLPVRIDFEQCNTLPELLTLLQKNHADCEDVSYLGLADIQQLSQVPNGMNLFDSVLVFENYPTAIREGSDDDLGVTISNSGGYEQTNYPLTLIAHHNDTLSVKLDYYSDQFGKETIARLAGHLENVLIAMAKHGETLSLKHIDVLSQQEQTQLLQQWNDTAAEFPENACLHTLFETQVSLQPDAIAITTEDAQLTYSQLNSKANQLAAYLIAQGVKPDSLVGLCFERSTEMIVAILAVLKAGGAYVPFDPDYPAARLSYLLENSGANIILTHSALKSVLPLDEQLTVCLDEQDIQTTLATYRQDNIDVDSINLTANNLSYVLYTSGSTGNPKGVMIEHQAIVNRLDWMQSQYPLSNGDKVLQKTPYSFDVSVWELLWAISVGAQLVFAKPGGHKEPEYLAELIKAHGITTLHYVPSMLKVMLDTVDWAACESVKYVFCSGEALTQGQVNAFYDSGTSAALHNLYGPTEAAIDVTYWDCANRSQLNTIPIGKPINNIQLYVLDPQLRVQPIGAVGELHIAGTGLARGYLNNAELTQQRFIECDHLGQKSVRLYKTGDLVRWLPDGNLEFLGRVDHQVKLRGFRIELGEIENQLSLIEGVKETAVLCREDAGFEPRLVAYVVPTDTLDEEAEDYQETKQALIATYLDTLSKILPEYMVPSVVVILDSMPLNNNGKIDRRSLPVPAEGDLRKEAYVAPTNHIEETLCDIWQDVLAIDQVGIHDNFFSLGGHSLLAVRVGAKVQDELGQPLPIKQLFDTPTIAGLAKYLEENQGAELISPLPRIEIDEELADLPFPLTGVQQSYLLGRSDVFSLGNVAAHYYSEVNFPGLDLDRLGLAWNRLIERHGVLRTQFSESGTQKILPEVPEYNIAFHDMRNMEAHDKEQSLLAIRDELSHQVFDVEQWPLFELRVSRIGDEHFRMHFSMDLLLIDGSSSRILKQELLELYVDPNKEFEPLNLSFRDYVLAEQQLEETPLYQNAKEYWTKRLEDIPMAPALPLAKDPSEVNEPKFVRRQYYLPADAWTQLQQRINEWQLTPTVFMLTVFSQVLNRWTKSNRFTLNLTLFNRLPMHDEVEMLLGDFTSLTLLEIEARSDQALLDNSRRIQDQLWDDLEHRYFGGTEVLRALNRQSASHQAVAMPVVFTSTLGLAGDQSAKLNIKELQSRSHLAPQDFAITQTSQIWLDSMVNVNEGQLTLTWDAVDELFPQGMLDEMFAAYSGLLQDIAYGRIDWHDQYVPGLPTSQVNKRALVNSTDVARAPSTLHGLFLEQVQSKPDNTAVIAPQCTLSYAQVDKMAANLASQLHQKGAQANKLVAIVMHKGWEQVVACMGILYSGAAYLPIDAGLPAERINKLLSIGEVDLVVTQSDVQDTVEWPTNVDVLSVAIEDINRTDTTRFLAQPNPTDLAYVIFTSGSTGEPKGVVIDHQGAANTCLDINGKFNVGEYDRALALSALNFDLSVYDIFGLLAAGGGIVMPAADKDKDPAHWVECATQHNVTIWNTVPALAQLLAEQLERLGDVPELALRVFLLSGDWLPLTLPNALRSYCQDAEVISLGGATEASIWSIYFPINNIDPTWKSIPYGKPLENQKFYVLKPDLRECADWVVGDLYIGGIGVAKGYWKDEEKTQSSFIINPHNGERLYKTGDLGRYRADGNIEFLGREDSQVKVHGHRIELGEIESALTGHDDIKDAIVLAVGENRHNKSLVAYIVPESGNADETQITESEHGEYQILTDGSERKAFKLEQHGLRKFAKSAPTISFAQPLDMHAELQISNDVDNMSLTEIQAAASRDALPQAKLGQWLATLAITNAQDQAIGKRSYPSAGSLYPVQTYCYFKEGAVEGVEPGVYYYAPEQHALICIDQGTAFAKLVSEQLTDLPLFVFLVADTAAIGPMYGDRTERFCALEAGHIEHVLKGGAVTANIALGNIATPAQLAQERTFSEALQLSEQHQLMACFGGSHTTASPQISSDTFTLVGRQSYREFKGEKTVTIEALSQFAAQLTWHKETLALYMYDKESDAFYLFDTDLSQFNQVTADLPLLSNSQVAGKQSVSDKASFSFYIVSQGESSLAVTRQAGQLGQRMMQQSAKLLIGLCPIGGLAFEKAGADQTLLYSFDGGAISEEQARSWSSGDGAMEDVGKALREYLLSKLPVYMAPTTYMVMDAFPLTPNGKINRKALPQPDQSTLRDVDYVAPRNDTERTLCGIWQELLNVEKVGVLDNFFTLGGHSLLAVRLGTQIQDTFNVSMPLKQLFATPNVEGIAQYLSKHVQQEAQTQEWPRIIPDESSRYEPFPLTGVQQAYLLGRSDAFALGNVSTHGYSEVNLPDLDVERLEEVWNRLIGHHEMLRAEFSNDGMQRILQDVPRYQIPYLDLRDADDAQQQLSSIRDELSHQVFDVSRWPLFELRVSRVGQSHYRLHFSMDLLLIDASSSMVLTSELLELYAQPGKEITPLSLSFRDYVLAEKALAGTPIYEKSRDYWHQRLEDLPMAPALPLVKDPVEVTEPKFVRRVFRMPHNEWQALQQKASRAGITPTVFLLTMFQQVLARWSKAPQFTLNLTLFNRLPMHEEVNQIVGDFTSLTLLQLAAQSDKSLLDNAKLVQSQLWEDLEHRYYDGIDVLRALNSYVGGSQSVTMPVVFTSALGLSNTDPDVAKAHPLLVRDEALAKQDYGISQTSQVWLDHQVSEGADGLTLIWDSIDELFPEGMLDDMFDAYQSLIEGISVDKLSMHDNYAPSLPVQQQTMRDSVNNTQAEQSQLTMHGLFRSQLDKHAEDIAVLSSDMAINYGQLDVMAGSMSEQLRQAGAQPNKLIAIVMEKGWEQVVAALAIQYAGAAYLPIDGNLPQERIEQLLALGEVDIALTQPHFADTINWPEGIEVLPVCRSVMNDNAYYLADEIPENLAYVIFTSGSTGTPKGVVIDHIGAVNTILDVNDKFNVSSADRAIALSALNFDLSVYDIFGLLACGGSLVLPDAGKEKEPTHWVELVERHQVTLWNTVPALAQLYVDELLRTTKGQEGICSSIRLFMLSGDWLPLGLPDQLRSKADAQVISLGGATEASIWSIYYPIDEVQSHWKSIPYGKPLRNQTFHVLKPDFSKCPDWVTGELYIGGIGLAKAYWGDPQKTANSFVTHPHTKERLYKTGDLGRYLPDGNIEFLGREDTQVKISGHRIELGEIESVLNKHDQIQDAIVTTVGESRFKKRLAAYIVPKQPQSNALQSSGMSIVDEQGQCQFTLLEDNQEKLLFKLSQKGLRNIPDSQTHPLTHKPDVHSALYVSEHAAPISVAQLSEHSQTMSQEQLGSWLSCLAQVPVEGHSIPKRSYASAGSLYPVQTYLYFAPGAVDGLASGFYYYDPAQHQLQLLSDQPVAGHLDNALSQLPMAVFLVADYEAMGPIYGNETARFSTIEAGHMHAVLDATSGHHHLATAPLSNLVTRDTHAALTEALSLSPAHQLMQCLAVASIERTVTTASVPLLARQSYRQYLPQPVTLDDAAKLVSQATTETQGCAVYLHTKADNVFYVFDQDSQQFKVSDDASLTANNDEGVNKSTYERAAFSLFLVGDTRSHADYLRVGEIGQRLMQLAYSLEMGLCPIGSVAFKQTHDGKPMLYSFEGGMISQAQTQQWEATDAQDNNVESRLRVYLEEHLPTYMIPAAFVLMERFPLTPNGKVNRKALPEPHESQVQQHNYVAPTNELEASICEVWQRVLGNEQVGIEDNFFEIGGNSLSAIQVLNGLRDILEVADNELSLGFFFRNPYPKKLAEAIEMKIVLEKAKTDVAELQDSDVEMGEL
ncbi:amino acid adenylation domain-containing protein [Pseudoalteromonas luteoviolacea]|uniref:non-ribosomal peptide synthetase n=1 Tax=Pseudoalteromonas luteoviolacea TaxID=43657 RepID=UPI001B35BA5C|nr:non-ribosomal peptide synthetase [Pseudoalteromonas luteoviolacea]MBQ4814053.1 amino acid adenylation domain-containing protein [Pseudoalteromonas luteoviolacea]